MKPKLFIFALLALLVASCTDEIDIPEPTAKEGEMVTINATIPQEDTRVTYHDNTRKLAWADNDQLLLAGYDGTTYIGNSTFTWTGEGNKFNGTAVAGATTYKAYYPASAITLDENGNTRLPADFWEQTQNGSSNKHLGDKLLLFDEEAKTLGQTFTLAMKNDIIRLFLRDIPKDIIRPQKVIWTVQTTAGGESRSAILNIDDVFIDPMNSTFDLIVYLAFDPGVMKIAENGKVKIKVIGTGGMYEWTSDNITAGKTYSPGKRYRQTVVGWTKRSMLTKILSYKIHVSESNTKYPILLKNTTTTTSPADLKIDWGDGTTTNIAQGQLLANAIAEHHYGNNTGDYTIKIYSSEADPTFQQMPQITFYNRFHASGDKLLREILDPFPNMGATDFNRCFKGCTGLTDIPAEFFKYNLQAESFMGCFSGCTGLTAIPTDPFKHNTEAKTFLDCFYNCNQLEGTIPEDLFKHNTKATSFSQCFYFCKKLSGSIPANLFRYNVQTETFDACFSYCYELTTVPTDLFRYNTKARSFAECFSCCYGLTSIPAGLFNNNTQTTDFSSCFYYCSHLQLRADIFPDPEVPENKNFFEGREMNFEKCFSKVGYNLAPSAGTAPKLWLFNGTSSWNFTDCFTGSTKLTNYNDIPASWGGGGS